MTTLKALIFDVDGTLADTEGEGHLPAFNQAFADFGLDWDWDRATYKQLLAITGGKERMRHFHRSLPAERQIQELEQLIPQLHERKNAYYQQWVIEGRLPWRPGVRRLMDEAASAGLQLAVATTTTRENVEALLQSAFGPDFDGHFAILACADTAPVKKPSPDVYHAVLDKLQLQPGECLAFEDSENGVRAARAAEVPVLVTPNDFTEDHDFSGALAVLDHLGEPDRPCRALAGPAPERGYVDVAYLESLHRSKEAR